MLTFFLFLLYIQFLRFLLGGDQDLFCLAIVLRFQFFRRIGHGSKKLEIKHFVIGRTITSQAF